MLILFKSYKSRSVTRFVVAGEVIEFSDILGVAAVLATELETFIRQKVPVQLVTDRKSLPDFI